MLIFGADRSEPSLRFSDEVAVLMHCLLPTFVNVNRVVKDELVHIISIIIVAVVPGTLCHCRCRVPRHRDHHQGSESCHHQHDEPREFVHRAVSVFVVVGLLSFLSFLFFLLFFFFVSFLCLIEFENSKKKKKKKKKKSGGNSRFVFVIAFLNLILCFAVYIV